MFHHIHVLYQLGLRWQLQVLKTRTVLAGKIP